MPLSEGTTLPSTAAKPAMPENPIVTFKEEEVKMIEKFGATSRVKEMWKANKWKPDCVGSSSSCCTD